MRVGVVGTGRLGGHLANRLVAAGFDVTVHDRDANAVSRVDARATRAASAAAAASGADAVLTCLPSVAAVTDAVAGAGGVLEALAPGATWIDTSTNDGAELARLAGIAAARGVATLEAPVTGGVHLAATGGLTVIVGGDEEVLERCLPCSRRSGSACSTSGRSA